MYYVIGSKQLYSTYTNCNISFKRVPHNVSRMYQSSVATVKAVGLRHGDFTNSGPCIFTNQTQGTIVGKNYFENNCEFYANEGDVTYVGYVEGNVDFQSNVKTRK